MSEIDRAIKDLSTAIKSDCLADYPTNSTMRLAIEALKEKQQREDAGALTGTWIDKHYEDAPWAHRVICSVCGLVTGDRSNYCPCCGARMTKPQSAEQTELEG